MARLPALVKKYAELDGRSERRIQWYARVAREHGLITSGKRGVGASHMTITDAVNLLLVCNGDSDPKLAPTAAEQIREFSQGLFFEDEQKIILNSLRPVIAANRFGEALELVMSSSVAIQSELLALEEGNSRTAEKIRSDPFDAAVGFDVVLGREKAVLILRQTNRVDGDIQKFRLEYVRIGARTADTRPSLHRQIRIVLSLEVLRSCYDVIADTMSDA